MSRRRGAPWVLGLACSHDGAACLLHGGEVVVAVREERLARKKILRLHAAGKSLAVRYCLEAAGIGAGDLDLVVAAVQGSRRSPLQDLSAHPDLRPAERGIEHRTIPHHVAHAVSAAATAGWDDAAVLVLDGLGSPADDLDAAELAAVLPVVGGAGGEHGGVGGSGGGFGDCGAGGADAVGWEIASLYAAADRGATLIPLEKHLVPGGLWLYGDTRGMRRFGSLGGLYAAASWQIFGDHRQAGKVMGLAGYGNPEIPVADFLAADGPRLAFSERVPAHWPPTDRWAEAPARAAALAASVQRALEEGVLHYVRRLGALSGRHRLAYAGGVALNGLANERIAREGGFDELYVPPAADDAGTAVGAAYWGLALLGGLPPGRRRGRDEAGRRYAAAAVDAALGAVPGLVARRLTTCEEVVAVAADRIVAGQLIGWFQGGSELGPRALGQRSILADPRTIGVKERLNARVKQREPFRPYAPAILAEAADDWFEPSAVSDGASPFMLRIRRFRAERRAAVPAVDHADGSGRLQTLTRADHGLLYDLVAAFAVRTGVPMLLETSFNGRGEPMVETPEDALWCLLATGLDACILDDRLVERAPGVDSLLDLVPRRIEVRIEVHAPGGGEAAEEGFVAIEAPSRWGSATRYFGVEVLAVLAAIDGERDGRALLPSLAAIGPPREGAGDGGTRAAWTVETLERWSRHAGPDGLLPGGHSPLEVAEILAREREAPADEAAAVRLLARLRAAGAIGFSEPRSAPPGVAAATTGLGLEARQRRGP